MEIRRRWNIAYDYDKRELVVSIPEDNITVRGRYIRAITTCVHARLNLSAAELELLIKDLKLVQSICGDPL